jgi:hypothetical protein
MERNNTPRAQDALREIQGRVEATLSPAQLARWHAGATLRAEGDALRALARLAAPSTGDPLDAYLQLLAAQQTLRLLASG